MPALFDRIVARFAAAHARGVYARFRRSLGAARAEQQAALERALAQVRDGDFGRRFGLRSVRSLADLRRAVPLQTYEDLRPFVERVAAGETRALFSPHVRVVMFATSSGTTAQRKLIPVTPAFVADYRRGWNTFGVKMLGDHPRAVLRAILQSSGRFDESRSPAGIPIGAITGLMARTQKWIVRRHYVGTPALARIADPRGRFYALARFGVTRDVAFGVTANPATLIRIAQIADEESERLIRDVRDGTLSAHVTADASLARRLGRGLRPDPRCAARLESLRRAEGRLRPSDFWRLEFLACWTGGSMGGYLPTLREWYGDVPVRDVGLLASEGRVTIPLEDGSPAGPLDVGAACFEFIPLEQFDAPDPQTRSATELETGRDYAVVLTNTAGLVRYRLDDAVRVRGHIDQTPVLEFLHRAGRVASIAGEKLTEQQLVVAVDAAARGLGLVPRDFIAAPCWGAPPFYRLTVALGRSAGLAERVDAALGEVNCEYAERRRSGRLGPIQVRDVPVDRFQQMDRSMLAIRGTTAEQYKRTILFRNPGEDDLAIMAAE